MNNKEIGNFGEDVACKYLLDNGIDIIKRNFYCRGGEIDIIAKDEDTIVFVEVKTRKSADFGTPGEFVDYRKQEKIAATALYYLGNNDTDMRFDVIEVLYKMCGDVPMVTEINHIKSAF